jgi:hypothetical protein
MVKAGAKIGASPANWYGTLTSISLSDLRAESYLSGKWEEADREGLVIIAGAQKRIMSANPKDVGMKVA